MHYNDIYVMNTHGLVAVKPLFEKNGTDFFPFQFNIK